MPEFDIMLQWIDDQIALLEAQAQALESQSQVLELSVNVVVKWSASHEKEDETEQSPEFGEQERLRLQITMDRMSKLETLISNVLRKQADARAALTSNLKA
jgi:hypothetical protein